MVSIPLLRVPKFVIVTNPQLNCLYHTTFTIVFLAQLIRFSLVMEWTEKLPVQIELNVDIDQNSIMDSYILNRTEADICNEEFRFQRAGVNYLSQNNICVPMCRWDQTEFSDKCIHPLQTYRQESANELTIITARMFFAMDKLSDLDLTSNDLEMSSSWSYVLSAEPIA